MHLICAILHANVHLICAILHANVHLICAILHANMHLICSIQVDLLFFLVVVEEIKSEFWTPAARPTGGAATADQFGKEVKLHKQEIRDG